MMKTLDMFLMLEAYFKYIIIILFEKVLHKQFKKIIVIKSFFLELKKI